MFQVDQERRAKYEEGLAEGLSAYDAAIAAGYCPRYARKLASVGSPTEKEIINFAWKQIHDKNCPDRVKQRYWEKLGEYYRLWGARSKGARKQEPVDFPIEGGDNGGSPKG